MILSSKKTKSDVGLKSLEIRGTREETITKNITW